MELTVQNDYFQKYDSPKYGDAYIETIFIFRKKTLNNWTNILNISNALFLDFGNF